MDSQNGNAPPPGSGGTPEGDHDHLVPGDSVAEGGSAADHNSLLSAARSYLARGLTPIRLGPRSKVPPGKHDDNTITAENAARLLDVGGYNIGLRLGPEHGGLVDFDLDWPEARRLGGLLLDRFARFGRAGAPGSHYLLRCSTAIKSRKYDAPELKGLPGLPGEHAVCVLEVRASGHTMAPPSVHPSGEAVAWERDPGLLEDNAEGIHQRAGLLAFLSVVARFYPAQGSRDDFCMALAGALLSAGLSPEDADRCVVRVAEVAGDEEAGKRRKAGQTAAKADNGQPVTGLPRVVEALGLPEAVARRFRDWLGIPEGRPDNRPRVVYSENRLPETLDAAEAALLAAAVPIYQMAGMLVQPVRLDASEDSDGVNRRAGALVIREVRPHRLRELMIGAANFVKVVATEDGPKDVPAAPPLSFALTRTLFIANGNNLEFRADMSTRAILCTMDARLEKPETRKFSVDLRAEVPRRRGELVAAALTVLRAHAAAGRPGDLTPFGRFEEWSATVRAALVWAGEADPCATREAVSVGDSAKEELAALIEAWEAAYGLGKEVRASDVARDADPFGREALRGAEALAEALRTACPRGVNARSVGIYLAKNAGRIVRGRRIVRRPDDKDASTFHLEVVR